MPSVSRGGTAADKDVFFYIEVLSGFVPTNPSPPLTRLDIISFLSAVLTVVAFEEILSGLNSVNFISPVAADTGDMTGAAAPGVTTTTAEAAGFLKERQAK